MLFVDGKHEYRKFKSDAVFKLSPYSAGETSDF